MNQKIIGIKVARSRVDRGLSQAQLGAKIQRTRSQISKWETGKQEIPSSALYAIAQVLNVDIRFFSPYTARTTRVLGETSDTASSLIDYSNLLQIRPKSRDISLALLYRQNTFRI